jgi:hypothetical protein
MGARAPLVAPRATLGPQGLRWRYDLQDCVQTAPPALSGPRSESPKLPRRGRPGRPLHLPFPMARNKSAAAAEVRGRTPIGGGGGGSALEHLDFRGVGHCRIACFAVGRHSRARRRPQKPTLFVWRPSAAVLAAAASHTLPPTAAEHNDGLDQFRCFQCVQVARVERARGGTIANRVRGWLSISASLLVARC